VFQLWHGDQGFLLQQEIAMGGGGVDNAETRHATHGDGTNARGIRATETSPVCSGGLLGSRQEVMREALGMSAEPGRHSSSPSYS
jgi:hypothetical protein